MRRILTVGTTAAMLLASFGANSYGQDLGEWARQLKRNLEGLGGPIDEGSKDNRNSVGTGSVKDWLTYPGRVIVSEPNREGEGEIIYIFSGRERVADYVLGSQTDTNDYQTSGEVTAHYSFTFGGRVLITNTAKNGGRGRVGNSVAAHVNAQNGTIVGGRRFEDYQQYRSGREGASASTSYDAGWAKSSK